MKYLLTLLVIAAGLLHADPAIAGSESAAGAVNPSSSGRCNALSIIDLSKVPDAPTRVISAAPVNGKDGLSAYCEVHGYVEPDVGFALWLPANGWSGKFIELGCGGSCGNTEFFSECSGLINQGYVCIGSDGGHKSTQADEGWLNGRPQAAIEYLVRSSHVTALAGKAIAARYYSRPPRRSYFMGCSAGGHQGMEEAEKFPYDFDGIIAGDPVLESSAAWVNWVWANRAMMKEDSHPLLTESDLELIHHAVVTKCDRKDGLKDGVIGDPLECNFDPAALRCAAGQLRGCLTEAQVSAVERIYEGPRTSDGRQIFQPIAMRGSELSWLTYFAGTSKAPNQLFDYFKDAFEYSVFPIDFGPGWKPEDFNFDRDYRRLGALEALEPDNPDLRRFKASGAKLLAYTGWSDALEGVLNTIDYYETVERVMGGRAQTQDFFRLFVIPGMNHCTLGDGAFDVNYLNYLEAWVEDGKAPEKVIGYHVKLDDLTERMTQGDLTAWKVGLRRLEFPLDPATVKFSRPIYPYPVRTRYLGQGDPSLATNFGPVQP